MRILIVNVQETNNGVESEANVNLPVSNGHCNNKPVMSRSLMNNSHTRSVLSELNKTGPLSLVEEFGGLFSFACSSLASMLGKGPIIGALMP